MIPTLGYGNPRTDLLVFDDMLIPSGGSAGDNLNTRASSYGGTPTKVPPFTGNLKLDSSGRCYPDATSSLYYWPSSSPVNGDYVVTGLFELLTKTSSSSFGLLTRVDDSVFTGLGKAYWFRWTNGNFQLYRVWQGQTTPALQQGSNVAYTLNAGDQIWLRLQATGTSTVTIVADRSADGITWTNVFNVAQSTNGPITSAGKPGLIGDEAATSTTLTHCHLLMAA